MNQLETRLEQQLLREWVADLHLRALCFIFLGQVGGGEGSAVNAVASRAGSNGDDRVADTLRHGANQVLFVQNADAHRVDEGIALIRFIERDFAADRWNADAITVIADALYYSCKQIPHAR